MNERRSLEIAWDGFMSELSPYLPEAPRRKTLEKIVDVSLEISAIKESLKKDPFLKNAAQRYFGLDPLKISALNLAFRLESDELRFINQYLQLTHQLILANILRMRIIPQASKKFQTLFSPSELAHYPAAQDMMNGIEKDLLEEARELEQRVNELRTKYELHLFEESSHEASRSFGATSPNIRQHHSSWVAFAQLLTGLAVQVHESQKSALVAKAHKISARRETLFESCAELFAKASVPGHDKKVKRQLRNNLAEIKKLEKEIETTLQELSVPGIHDYASFIMKKTPDESKTSELNISQSTGEKT